MEAKGDIPKLEEVREKLRCLQEIGPSPDACIFQDLFDRPGNPA